MSIFRGMTNTPNPTVTRRESIISGERTVTFTVAMTYKYDAGEYDPEWMDDMVRDHVVESLRQSEGASLSSTWIDNDERVSIDILPGDFTVDVAN